MTTTERRTVLVDHGHVARRYHRLSPIPPSLAATPASQGRIRATRGGVTALDGPAAIGGTVRSLAVDRGGRVDE